MSARLPGLVPRRQQLTWGRVPHRGPGLPAESLPTFPLCRGANGLLNSHLTFAQGLQCLIQYKHIFLCGDIFSPPFLATRVSYYLLCNKHPQS